MGKTSLIAQPFLDWHGIWPGQAGRDDQARSWLQDPPQGIRLRVQPARKSAPWLRSERPWEGLLGWQRTVLFEEDRYRMWYWVSAPDAAGTIFTCYAESVDGFDWERPELGLYEFQNSSANNIISERSRFSFDSVFIDPVAPAEERYKAIDPQAQFFRRGEQVPSTQQTKMEFRAIRAAMQGEGCTPGAIDAEAEIRQVVRGAVSADGLHWKILEKPLIEVGKTALDSQNVAAYDEDTGEYVAYLRGHLQRRRSVRRTGGSQFGNWHPTRIVLTIDPQDEPDDDIHAPCYCRCPGSGRHLMFASIFHRLSATRDVQLATSWDGWHWTRPDCQPIITRETEDGEYSTIDANPTLVPLGKEWGLPYFGGGQRHDTWGAGPYFGNEFRWAMWKPDRLVALEAPTQGQLTTIERICQGKELRLNFQTEVGGWVRVGLAHKPTTPPTQVQELKGYGIEDCDVMEGDEISKAVTWRGEGDLSALKGREISVRIRMARAKLFSVAL